MREDNEFSIAEGDPDPRGYDVVGADGLIAGVVSDVWVDRSEFMIRYLEVEFLAPDSDPDNPTTKRVLFPMTFATVDSKRQRVWTDALLSTDFQKIPTTKAGVSITRLEEDKVMAFFSGGSLYATPLRAEPLL
jgi:photosynthetic reaction center H subunit